MKNHLIQFLLFRSIVILSVLGLVAYAGDEKSNAPDSLKAELTEQHEVQLSWMGTQSASQFGVYRAEVKKVSEDLDYSKLEFTKLETVKENEFTDKILIEDTEGQLLPELVVYYVATIDKSGKQGDKSNYAEVNLSMESKEKIIN
jgi:hypothetical protein